MTSQKYIFSIVLAALSLVIFASQALALTVSPVKVDIAGDPGQTLTGELELFNEQVDPKTLYSSYENFEPSGETGSPKFTGGTSGLATWISTVKSIVVEPDQTLKVPYSITIPADAEPGGYFSAIFWSEENPAAKQGGDVSIGGKLGVLILLRVNGDIKEAAGVSNFGLDGVSRWQTNLPLTFAYRFKNDGGDRVVPLGNITIKNTFGGITATIPANVTEGSVLPNSLRKFQSVWGTPLPDGIKNSFLTTVRTQFSDFHFGVYTAHLSVTYGATNMVADSSFTFFLIPWQLLLVAFAGLSILIILLKQYNRWIIAKSKINM